MGLFNFGWFKSAERKQLEEENMRLRLQMNDLADQRDSATRRRDEAINIITEKQAPARPFRNIFYDEREITVVFSNGDMFTRGGVDRSFLNAILTATSSEAIIDMFFIKQNIVEEAATDEEKDLIAASVHILKETGDFDFIGGNVYLKGVNLNIPEIVLASFIEFTEKKDTEKYEALKMFWLWTSLNPIESSRKDLLSFVRRNDVTITKHGLLELYRRVVTVGNLKDKALANFVSEQYIRVKRWKKSPSNYEIFEDLDTHEVFSNKEGHKIAVELHPQYILIGNLEDLYLDLPNLQENHYTDGHTKTKTIKLGAVYSEDESKIDLNNQRDCSSGLHVGSKSFGFDGFGDVGVLALVNPMKVRSVPASATNKMRVSEMFVVGLMDENEFKNSGESDGLNDFSEEYFGESVEVLLNTVKNKDFGALSCQDNDVALSLPDIGKIAQELKNRIVNV